MNIIQIREKVAFFNDRVKSARFPDSDYMKAIQSAITSILEDRLDNIKDPKKYSFESVQRVRDELYTLVPPTLAIVPSANIASYPSDYNYFLKMQCVVDGEIIIAKATNYNESGVLFDNPFKSPDNIDSGAQVYFDQNLTGFNIIKTVAGSLTSVLLDYIKNPDTVSVGTSSNKINSGLAVLTIGIQYIVDEECVHNGIVYEEGDIFTAVSTSLTSGVVIPISVIVNCNLPVKIHEEVAIKASQIMNGIISDFEKSQALKQEDKEN